jgi:hypothetical protein
MDVLSFFFLVPWLMNIHTLYTCIDRLHTLRIPISGKFSRSIDFSHSLYDFGILCVSSERSAANKEALITATNVSLYPNTLSLLDVSPSCFSLQRKTWILQPGEYCQISVLFAPKCISTQYFGCAEFEQQNGYRTKVYLKGVGAGALVSITSPLTPGVLDFGRVKAGITKTIQITCRNSGLIDAQYKLQTRLSCFSFNELNNDLVTGDLPSSSSVTLDAIFDAEKLSSFQTKVCDDILLQWRTVGLNSWNNIPLKLIAEVGVPKLHSNSDQKIDFGVVMIGRKSVKNFQLANTGSAPLLFVVLEFEDLDGVDVFPMEGSLPPGAIIELDISFNPMDVKLMNGEIEIISDGGVITLNLNGAVGVPNLIFSNPLDFDFGVVAKRRSQEYPLEIKNTGNIQISFMVSYFTFYLRMF